MLYNGEYSIIQAAKQYMHYVNCIYIDSETNYFLISIDKSPKHNITNSSFKLCVPYVNLHLN